MNADTAKIAHDLVVKLHELPSHAEKCAFFHDAKHFPHLSKVMSEIHFPKPAAPAVPVTSANLKPNA